MATASFQARIERIEKSQAAAPQAKPQNFRTPGMAGVQAVRAPQRRYRRHPIMDHMVAVAFGIVLGCLVSVAFWGLNMQGMPWGPGGPWHNLVYYPIIGSLGAGPLLMLMSVFVAAKRPAFALFSLGYITGIAVTLLL